MRKFVKITKFILLILILIVALTTVISNIVVIASTSKQMDTEIESCDAIVVLGAMVYEDGTLSEVLRDRVAKGCELYFAGVSDKILMSGDHSRVDYNEVAAMKEYAISLGVPEEAIFTDGAGFSTYESAYRAKNIFLCDTVVMVTQAFHINRAVFLGKAVGMTTYGVTCDEEDYQVAAGTAYIREPLARVKAAWDAIVQPAPTYEGEAIPITGDASASWDTSIQGES